MSVIQPCFDVKDTLDLFRPQGLYLKPVSRLNVSVQLPQLKKSGAKISNWEVMERVKDMAKPFTFPVFKVAKSSLEFIRFEAEIENYGSMDQVLAKLDMKTIKLGGFHEVLKVRAAEAKPPFPSRSDWDAFFNDSKSMDQRKPGERPDTIHLQNLPTKWFVNHQDRSGIAKDKPSEFVLKKVFGTFGEIRAVDIPMLDPYRDKMKASISGIQTFTFGQDLVFDAFIQYKEYIGFVKAMNSLKGMKVLFKDRYEDRSWAANVKVDFDKTKHLSDSSIKQRAQVREKLADKEREKDEKERRRQELEELKRSEEQRRMEEERKLEDRQRLAQQKVKEKRRQEREERRRQQKLRRRQQQAEEEDDDDEAFARKIAVEERKLVVAQRKLESIRLLDELLERVKAKKSKGSMKTIEEDLLKTAAKEAKGIGKAATILSLSYKDQDEKWLRDKLVNKLKQKEVDKMESCGKRITNARRGHNYNSDFSDISDQDLEDEDSDSLESVSDDDGDGSADEDDEEEENSEELNLTSSTDEDDEELKKEQKKKAKKLKKKAKKQRKKEKKERRRAAKEEEREARKKKRDLDSHISLAQRISERERRSRSRENRRRPGSREQDTRRRHRSRDRDDRDGGYPDYRTRMAEERALRRQREREAARDAAKKEEQAKEEMYDRMMNPHLYGAASRNGGDGDRDGSYGGYRKIKRGEHYEDVQKKELERQIWEKEYDSRLRREQREERAAMRRGGNYGRGDDGPGYGYSRGHRHHGAGRPYDDRPPPPDYHYQRR